MNIERQLYLPLFQGYAVSFANNYSSILSTPIKSTSKLFEVYCLLTLDAAIKRNIPSGVQTSWSDEVRNNWETYYSADVPAAMADMKLSATNLRLAVDQALKYSNEQ